MRLFAAIFLLLVAPAYSQQVPILLTCQGFNRQLSGTISHFVEIKAATGVVDGEPYNLIKSNDSYVLIGPLPSQSFRFILNRIDGSYLIMHNGSNPIQIDDWSRPEDSGCSTARQKF